MNSTVEWVFGLASLLSLLFAIYTYFKSREFIYPLLEKLRATRNSFAAIELTAKRIVLIADLKEKSDQEKVMIMRQLARSIEETSWTRMNTIDNGTNWGELSVSQIYKLIAK
jgi:hypothetical protein